MLAVFYHIAAFRNGKDNSEKRIGFCVADLAAELINCNIVSQVFSRQAYSVERIISEDGVVMPA